LKVQTLIELRLVPSVSKSLNGLALSEQYPRIVEDPARDASGPYKIDTLHLPDNPIFGNEDQEDYCQKIETFSKILFYVFYHDYAMAERLGSDVPYDGIRQLRRHRLLPKRRYHFWKRWHTAQDVATIPIRLTTPVNSSNLYGSPHEIQLARN
jgi:hypothetical protein